MVIFTEWQVNWTAEDGTVTTLDNVIDVRITIQKDGKNNTAEFILDNSRQQGLDTAGEIIYQTGESFTVYAADGVVDTADSTHLLGIYNLKDPSFDAQTRKIKFTASNRTYDMLASVFVGLEQDTVPNIIDLIVQRTRYDGTTTTPVTTDIDALDSTGGAFPTIDFASNFKTSVDAILELSQPSMTGDTQPYQFWFDENDTFHWHFPGTTVEATTLEFGVEPVLDMKGKKAESETIAMIIYNAGEDKSGDGIVFYEVNPDATSLDNIQMYQPWTDISRDLEDKFTKDVTYAGMSNATFIANCKTAAIARAQRIFLEQAGTNWEITVNSRFQNYDIGGLYLVKGTNLGLPGINLRLDRIVYKFNMKEVSALLTLKEDSKNDSS